MSSSAARDMFPSMGAAHAANPFLRSPRTVGVYGAALSLGQPIAGVEKAPDILRKAHLADLICRLGWGIQDKGNIGDPVGPDGTPIPLEPFTLEGVGTIRNARAMGEAARLIAEASYTLSSEGLFSLILGGDHSIALGSIAGVARAHPDLGVIWVDAHGDYNTPQTSPSGNLHGMPLAALTGAFDLKAYPGFEWFHSCLSEGRVALVGCRSIDPGERQLLKERGVRVFTMTEIDRHGIGRVMEMALEAIDPYHKRPLHLSYDIDALDPSIAPGTGTRVRGGLDYREGHYICEFMAETRRLVSMDLVEVNPALTLKVTGQSYEEATDPTVTLSLELLESAFGKRIMDA